MARCVICQKLYEPGREMTCSDDCHQELVRRLIAEFGEFKKVVHMSTGIAYRVPTRDIIDKGLKEEELDQYPIWGRGGEVWVTLKENLMLRQSAFGYGQARKGRITGKP